MDGVLLSRTNSLLQNFRADANVVLSVQCHIPLQAAVPFFLFSGDYADLSPSPMPLHVTPGDSLFPSSSTYLFVSRPSFLLGIRKTFPFSVSSLLPFLPISIRITRAVWAPYILLPTFLHPPPCIKECSPSPPSATFPPPRQGVVSTSLFPFFKYLSLSRGFPPFDLLVALFFQFSSAISLPSRFACGDSPVMDVLPSSPFFSCRPLSFNDG